ncbi:type II toxin-antitoxin system VapC family toxin [Almyronema epifaneia]|uniref:Type II toxin-antitoxin system VapC family toxin n=1 Tax=Almyronema epifaneia S1 TaxID=2991925 RepID=A0ABW6IEH3_9CYAN
MIAVDTNVVVRLLTQDDEVQYEKSLALFSANDIFIPDTVILEPDWVLRFAYNFAPREICSALRNLFGLANVQLSNGVLIAQVLQWHEQGLDLADAFHLAQSQNYDAIYTFDRKFVQKAVGLSACKVCLPQSI